MDKIEVVKIEKITESAYMRPKRVTYKQDGKTKIWDYFTQHDSVAILIFNVDLQSIVFVKQFRPAVYMTTLEKEQKQQGTSITDTKLDVNRGITLELCAGIIDREEPPETIAAAEVFEETGYKVEPKKLQFIAKSTNIGLSGAMQYLYYVEVDNSDKVSAGGGLAHEGEMIDLHMLHADDVASFMADKTADNRPAGLLLALTWFQARSRK